MHFLLIPFQKNRSCLIESLVVTNHSFGSVTIFWSKANLINDLLASGHCLTFYFSFVFNLKEKIMTTENELLDF